MWRLSKAGPVVRHIRMDPTHTCEELVSHQTIIVNFGIHHHKSHTNDTIQGMTKRGEWSWDKCAKLRNKVPGHVDRRLNRWHVTARIPPVHSSSIPSPPRIILTAIAHWQLKHTDFVTIHVNSDPRRHRRVMHGIRSGSLSTR
jgi:hypothetical protein